MGTSKRPSTSSLRRFITSRPYVPVAEIRRRFGLDEPDAVQRIAWNGGHAFVGLPEREASKVAELIQRGEVGLELSVEIQAPVVVGIYPMRIARYVIDQANGRNAAYANGNGATHADSDDEDGDPSEPMPGDSQRPYPGPGPQPRQVSAS